MKSVEEWISFVFDRPPSDIRAEWFHADDFVEPDIEKSLLCSHVSKVFGNINKLMNVYSDVQLANGLNYIISPFASSTAYALLDQSVPEVDRLSAISSMKNVFVDLFEKKCNSSSAHLNFICHMWWDMFPRHGVPFKSFLKMTDELVLSLMEDLLHLENPECKKSGLHGLGHWYFGYPDTVAEIIERNIVCMPGELKEYARKAKHGEMQ
ncbi:hypothetical protein HDN1F_01950 [gamma proteobacterium HdN1]|nr:hypothetical protein HDN1F_01950 [gamma proteobacterium HdN1]